ncbi:hypothetical protein HOC13_01140 [Candidatus Woesearchaeota archaeon]|jgi:hypothetical protein|nr:hypothetical protein [Candidatus Woesearchaeota archaeon]
MSLDNYFRDVYSSDSKLDQNVYIGSVYSGEMIIEKLLVKIFGFDKDYL